MTQFRLPTKLSLLIILLISISNFTFSQINVTTTWQAEWATYGGPNPAGLDTAALPTAPPRFGSVALFDLDGDGDKDLISGSNRGRFYFFENTGTATAPHWQLSTGAIPTLDSIHIGISQNTNEVRPQFADLDADGDLDLLVHSRWNYYGNHKLDDLHFYRNIGSATNPIFTRDTIPGLEFQQVAEFSSPGFGDLDNDGDIDIVMGGSDSCTYFENVGTATSPSYIREYGSSSLFPPNQWVESSFLLPTVDLEDFDNDGDLDMYFMNEAGFIRYIPNNGTSTTPNFAPYISYPAHSFDTTDFGAFGTIAFEDVNGDGTKDLMATHWNPTSWYWYSGVPSYAASITVNAQVSCTGLTDGQATASIFGGTTPYTYAWSNGATTASISGLAVGTYTVTVTDSTGITTTASTAITVGSDNIAPTITVCASTPANIPASASCTGTTPDLTGSVTATDNCTTSPTITQSPASGATLGLGTTTITLTATDGAGNTATCTVNQTVIDNTAPTITVCASTPSNIPAGASCTGTAPNLIGSVTATDNCTSSPTITQSPASGATLGLGTTTITLTATDGSGNTATCTVNQTVIDNTAPTITVCASTPSNIPASGSCTGTAPNLTGSVTATDNCTASPTITQSPSAGATLGLGTTTITLTATDGSGNTATCTVNQTVIDNTAPTFTTCAPTPTNLIANGSNQASAVDLTGSATASDNCTGTPTITQSPASGATLGLGTTTITLTATDGSGNTATCTVNQSVVLPFSASITSQTNASCNGLTDGSATVSAIDGTAPFTYAWSNGATTATINNLSSGIYTVTLTDGTSLTTSTSVTITEPTALIAATVVDSNISCNGLSDGGATASATGGTTPYSYAWSNAATTPSITGISAGTYTVTITDNNGCTATNSATITEPAGLILQAIVDSNVTCNGFSDGGASAGALLGTFPHTYTWSNGATTPSITGVTANTYSVTVTDNNGCTATNSVTITEPAALIATTVVDSNTSCNGFANGGATASATGGTTAYSYTWSNAATTVSITGVVAGTYTVTVTDANGCTSTSSSTVTEPAALVAASIVDSNATCNGFSNGGASASATGGTAPYSYEWNNTATTASITGISAGTYTATITDANGCTSTSSVTVTEPLDLAFNLTINSPISCNGADDAIVSYVITGGTAPYYNIFSGTDTMAAMATDTVGPVNLPQYVIYDANGCYDTTSVLITEPTALVAATVVDSNVTCNGFANGGITASASGGTGAYTYAWSNAATTVSITGVMANTYTVTVTDANGCTDTSSATITEPTALIATSVVDSNVTCNGLSNGGASASAIGGTSPYSYAWSNAATTPSITGVSAGTYTVTVTDANGCTSTSSATVTEPALLVAATVLDSNVTCFAGNDGGLTASASGGTTTYSYLWNTSATNASISGLSAGTYSVTVTDANGCTDSTSATVTEPPLVSVDLGNDTSVCFGGSLTLDAGAGFASYLWQDNSTNQTYNVDTSTPGVADYSVTVTNSNGCIGFDTINVTVFQATGVTISGANNLCAYEMDTLVASTGFVSYIWNTNATTPQIIIDANSLSPGNQNYAVTATDSNGCVSDDAVSFNVHSPVVVDLGSDTSIVWVDGSNNTYTLDAGAGFNSYIWSDLSTNQTLDVTLTNMGTISVVVTDGNGCFGTDSVFVDFILDVPTLNKASVNIYPNPAADYLNIDMKGFNGQEIQVIITDMSGKHVINNILKVNGNQTSTLDVSSLPTGTYFIQIQAANQKVVKHIVIR